MTTRRFYLRKALGFAILILVILTGSFVYSKYETSTFPPKKDVVCVEMMQQELATFNQTGFLGSQLTYSDKDITHVRCAAGVGFTQFELSGTTKDGHAFYLHDIASGMAASGADSISDICYKVDGVIVKNAKVTGRMSIPSTPTCSYDDAYLSQAPSQYTFNK